MRATIVHESRGRMRLRLRQKSMTIRQADLLETWLKGQPWTREAVVHERTGCVIVTYTGDREAVLSALGAFTWAGAESSVTLPGHSTRALNREFQEKLVGKVAAKAAAALFLPAPLRIARIVWHMIPFLHRGLRCLGHRQIKVEMLDALSIGISVCRRDFGTAGTVMFLLEIGELLEDWTRKKSVADLAESLSLHVDRVWLKTEAGEVLTPIGQIRPGDRVVVRAGSVIPLDSVVAEGEITVNQASLTGESVPVAKRPGGAVYAGTVVEEGESVLEVKQASGQSRYDQIVEMIQRSEQMKSAAEAKASNLADKLVPYTFAGSLLSLAAHTEPDPGPVGTHGGLLLRPEAGHAPGGALRHAGGGAGAHHRQGRQVPGGGGPVRIPSSLTRPAPSPTPAPGWPSVVPFNGKEEAEMLRLGRLSGGALSLTPWPMPWWRRPRRRGLRHEERHAKVEYLVAHGIASSVDGEQVRIGSAHFIFEDEKVTIPEGEQAKFDALPPEYSQLYLAIGGVLSAVICISDPLREEAKDVLSTLRDLGVKNAVMLTGDSPRTAAAIAAELGVDDFRAGVLPADKAEYVASLRREGHTVLMVGGWHQRLPGSLRGGCRHCHQRWGGHCPGDRRHHHRRRQPVGAGAAAAAGHGPNAAHRE